MEGLAPLDEIAPLETPPMAAAILAVTVGAGEPERFADPFEVVVSPATHGRWETTRDGQTAVWRLPVVSAGAVSLNFGFTRYRMPEGGRLRVLTPDGAEIVGPYTDADNKTHGELWTPLVSGSEAVIEVTVPVSRVEDLELDLGSVNRGFRDVMGVASRAGASCEVDVVCPAADSYRDQVRSVGLIVLTGTYQCSGVLLNNTARDRKPYFLTAAHCRDLDEHPDRARSAVVYWNYQAAECGAREFGGDTQTQTGAVVRAIQHPDLAFSDFALLELDAQPPVSANVYFAGWNRAPAPPSSSFIIHHGIPDPKAISIENDPAVPKSSIAVLGWDAIEPDPESFFLGVERLDQGSVESGSSGGPMFDQDKRVVGQLSKGQAGCALQGPVFAGRLAKSWSAGPPWVNRLSHWLDPLSTGETAIDGRNWNRPPTASGTLDDKSLRSSDTGSLTAELSYGFVDPDRDDLTYAVSSSDTSKVTATVAGSSVALTPVAAGSATITVTATDAGNMTATQTFTATVDGNRSPEASQAIAALTLDVDDGARSVDLSSVFADADGDALTYDASSSDTSVATVDGAPSGMLTVTPLSNGRARVLVTATDAAGSNTRATRSIEVVVNNRAPALILPSLTLRHAHHRYINVSDIVSDPDGDLLRYSVPVTPRFSMPLSVQRNGDILDLGPWGRGATTFTVTATDVLGSNTRVTHTVTVTIVNDAPRLVNPQPDRTMSVGDGEVLNLFRTVDDRDDIQLDWTVLSSNGAVATVALKPPSSSGFIDYADLTAVFPGTATITLTGVDAIGASATDTFEVTVTPPSPGPGESLSPQFLRVENGASSVDVSSAFNDPDDDDLTFAATSSDETVATVAAAGSVVTVTPLERGTTTVTVTATDEDSASATQAFEVTVPNRPPTAVGTLAALSLRVENGDETVDVSGAFTDADGDDLTFAAMSSNQTAATVAVSGSVVTVTPLSGGTTTVTVTATDTRGGSTPQAFEVTVVNRPPAPVDSLADTELQVGDGNEVVEVAAAFEDADEDPLTYGASSSAPGVAGAALSGPRVTLTPLARGTATITVTATDVTGSNTQASQRFDVRVKARRGVTVSTAALTVTEGSSETYTVALDSEPTGDVVVTATVPANTDVTVDPAALTFTIGDWQAQQSVVVEAAEDPDSSADPAVMITHQVSGSDYGSARASSVRVTIVETGTSTLSVTAAEASESSSQVIFEVTLSRPSGSEITVDYATSNDSGSADARAGSDYTAASGTLTFPANSTASQEIVVEITDDTEDEEEEETFRLTLRNPQNAELAGGGSTLQATGTIRDDDDPEVEVSFGSSSYGVTEGRAVDVVVRLNRDPERDLEIFLEETRHGGATDADYSGVPLSVAFGPGVRRQQFQVAATDDAEDDDGEAVVLSFMPLPSRVTAGGIGETTLAIQDNDGGSGIGVGGGPGGGGPGGGGGGGSPPSDDEDDPPPDDDDGGGGVQPPPPPAPSGPPKADFTLTAECAGHLCRARTGLPVTFEDTSTGRVQSRRWDFGDGTGSRNRRVDQVWSSPGFYEVALTVSDGTTESTARQVFLVEAGDPPGRASRTRRRVACRTRATPSPSTGGPPPAAAGAAWSTRARTTRACSPSSTGTTGRC